MKCKDGWSRGIGYNNPFDYHELKDKVKSIKKEKLKSGQQPRSAIAFTYDQYKQIYNTLKNATKVNKIIISFIVAISTTFYL